MASDWLTTCASAAAPTFAERSSKLANAVTNTLGSPLAALEEVRESWARYLLVDVLFPLSQEGFEPDNDVWVLSGEIVALAGIGVHIE